MLEMEVFKTTIIIAQDYNVKHRSVMKLLKKHSNTKTLSNISMLKVSRGGRPIEYAYLNQQQTCFLITLMKNSLPVVKFKEKLSLNSIASI